MAILSEISSIGADVYFHKDYLLSALSTNEKQKVQKSKEFYNTKVFIPLSGKPYQINLEQINKTKFSEINNYIHSFIKMMEYENRTLLFLTSTLKTDDRIKEGDNILTTIEDQHFKFNKFFTYLRQTNIIRGFKYMKTFELHKTLDLHSHNSYFVDDNFDSITKFIDFVIMGKSSHNLGRMDLVLDPKFEKDLVKYYNLTSKFDKKNGSYFYYYGSKENFKDGSSLIIRFFRNDENLIQQIVKYVVKYTLKTQRFDGKIDPYSAIFKYLNIRPFTSSKGVLAPVTAYRKVRSKLIAHDSKYSSMYEVAKAIKDKKLFLSIEYIEKETKASKLDNNQKNLCGKYNATSVMQFKEIEYNEDSSRNIERDFYMIYNSKDIKSDIPIQFENSTTIELYLPDDRKNDDIFDFENNLTDKTYRVINSVTITDENNIIASWQRGKTKMKNIWDMDFIL